MNRRCNARAHTQRVKAHVSRFLDDKSNSKTRAAEGAKWLRGWGDRCVRPPRRGAAGTCARPFR